MIECDEYVMNAVVLVPVGQLSAIKADAVAEDCTMLALTEDFDYPYETAELVQAAVSRALGKANSNLEYSCEVLCENHPTVIALKAKFKG